jgi:hypothetical protein
MADDAATRARRHRRHLAGDHAGCDPRRCREARAAGNGHTGPAVASVSGELAAFVATLDLPEGDPKRVIAGCAAIQAARVDEGDPPAAVVAALMSSLAHLGEDPGRPGGQLDVIRARHHQRRVRLLLGDLRA